MSKQIDKVKKAMEKGTKWTIVTDGNNVSMSIASLRFTPFELTTGMNATSFLDALRVSEGALRGGVNIPPEFKPFIFKGVAIAPDTLSRAAVTAARLIQMTHGRASGKLTAILSDEKLQSAMDATDNAADALISAQAELRISAKRTERAILRGILVGKNTTKNAANAYDSMNAEISKLKDELAQAKKNEQAVNCALIAQIFGNGTINITTDDESKGGTDETDGTDENAKANK